MKLSQLLIVCYSSSELLKIFFAICTMKFVIILAGMWLELQELFRSNKSPSSC